MIPRRPTDILIVGEEVWDPSDDSEMLPETWLRRTKNGLVPRKEKEAFFPYKLYFDEFGNCSEKTPMKWWGWFMKAPLLFDPTAGVFFDTKTNEGTKLTKLGSEGRSTSTTITAFSILNQLSDAGFKQEDQKLLSFTDNRQDAALQSGHFNDFVQVVRLRAGIRKALEQAPNGVTDLHDHRRGCIQSPRTSVSSGLQIPMRSRRLPRSDAIMSSAFRTISCIVRLRT